MGTAKITISVDQDLAEAFLNAQPDEQKKIELLLSLQLRELTRVSKKSLAQLMDEASAEAERNGLTPEILADILRKD